MRSYVLLLALFTSYVTGVPLKGRACATGVLPPTYDCTVAQTIYDVGTSLGVNAVVMLAGFEAAWVESHVNNLACGDASSLGVFQQIPGNTYGWGNAAEVQDPVFATTSFFNVAMRVNRNNPSLSAGDVAQHTQHSGHPTRYDGAQAIASSILSDVQAGLGCVDVADFDDPDEPIVDDEDNDNEDDNEADDAPEDDDYGYDAADGESANSGYDNEDDYSSDDTPGGGDDGGDDGDDGGYDDGGPPGQSDSDGCRRRTINSKRCE